MGQPCLLAVYGHPDDETFHAGGTLARYAAEGVRVVVLACTRGELGRIVDPALDTLENRMALGDLRMAELGRALAKLGPIEHRWLGYRDSGVAGARENSDPQSFCSADVDEATGRVVRIIREVRPQVIVTHNEAGNDGHPDHVRAALVARLAFERAGDAGAHPEQLAGAVATTAWAPSKLYESIVQYDRGEKLRRLFRGGGLRRGLPVLVRAARTWRPGDERERATAAAAQGARTTRIDVRPWITARDGALREYRSQMSLDDVLFSLSPDERALVTPTEDFSRRSSRVDAPPQEDDLFAGLHEVSAA
jgi:LmbE family N-acetylglucosaminyl deacetylase